MQTPDTAYWASGGGVTAGQVSHLHQNVYTGASSTQPPTPSVTWPLKIGIVPRAADCFQDRAETAAMDAALAAGGTAVLCQVLTGMGGVGKTQLAARYARQVWRSGGVELLIWVTATTRRAVIETYARAAASILGADPTDPTLAAQRLVEWLEPGPQSRRPVRWLVVLDDVTDPMDLTGLWPPDSPDGRTVVTTRNRDAAMTGASRKLVTVGLFTAPGAVEYLTESLAAHNRTESESQLAGLAADLGYLPLALSQASAYLVDTAISAAEYRKLLAGQAVKLVGLQPASLPDDQNRGVAAAWTLSIDRAAKSRPRGTARPLLEIASMFDPNGIPETVLSTAPIRKMMSVALQGSPDSEEAESKTGVTERDVYGVLRVLHRLSLVDHSPETPNAAVRVHQLVQRAVRDTMSDDHHAAMARVAADALLAAWPVSERDAGLAQTLRANSATLTAVSRSALHFPAPHPVLHRTGRSLGESGQVTGAAAHYRELTEVLTTGLGPHHPDTRAARGNFAQWRGAAGDAPGAVVEYETLVADSVDLHGLEHPDTLATLGNLAYWKSRAGDARGAVAEYEQLVTSTRILRGPDHPDTLAARRELANLRGQSGDKKGAAAELRTLVTDSVRALGADHAITQAILGQRAGWCAQAGDIHGAAAAAEDLLASILRVKGPDHPAALTARRNVVHWLTQAGRHADALAAAEDLLAGIMRVHDTTHHAADNARRRVAELRAEVRSSRPAL